MRLWSRVLFLFSTAALVAGVGAAPTQAADIEFALDETTATEAVTLIDAEGTGISLLTVELPCLLHRVRPTSPKLPSKLTRIDRIQRIDKGKLSYLLERPVIIGTCKTVIGSLGWSWKVVSASVDFASTGATLKGQILIEHPAGSTFITFAQPVQVAFVPAANSLYLSLQSGTVPVSAYIDGTLRALGSIDLTSFYQVSLPMTGAIPLATGGTVSSTLRNVTIQFSATKLTVTADVDFE